VQPTFDGCARCGKPCQSAGIDGGQPVQDEQRSYVHRRTAVLNPQVADVEDALPVDAPASRSSWEVPDSLHTSQSVSSRSSAVGSLVLLGQAVLLCTPPVERGRLAE
jgi:hypothetical protein